MNCDEHRKFKNRLVNRALWLFNGIVLSCLLLVLGPCNVGTWLYGDRIADLKKELNSFTKYGNGANWDGRVPHEPHYTQYECYLGQCFYKRLVADAVLTPEAGR